MGMAYGTIKLPDCWRRFWLIPDFCPINAIFMMDPSSAYQSTGSGKQFHWLYWQPSWLDMKLISQILPEVPIFTSSPRAGWKTWSTWENRQSV